MTYKIIVLDLDDTLCTIPDKFDSQQHKNAIVIPWQDVDTGLNYCHVFEKEISKLFDAIDNNGGRVVFFSRGLAERNEPVITTLLAHLYDETIALDRERFPIFSRTDLRSGKLWGFAGSYMSDGWFKDLRIVLREGEDINDAILIDDGEFNVVKGGKNITEPQNHFFKSNVLNRCLDIEATIKFLYEPKDWSKTTLLDFDYIVEETMKKRKELKLTQKKHALAANVSIPTMIRFQKKDPSIRVEVALKIINALEQPREK